MANEFVAVWVAKEDEVMRCDVGIGDLGIVFDARFTPELAAPFIGGMCQFVLDPVSNGFRPSVCRWGGRSESCP